MIERITEENIQLNQPADTANAAQTLISHDLGSALLAQTQQQLKQVEAARSNV